MDADRLISDCMRPGYRCAAREKCGAACVTNLQLRRIQNAVDAELRSYSLHRMLFGQS